MATIISVPVALIMKVDPPDIEVFRSSETNINPYKTGDRAHLAGLYCETVIKTKEKLLVQNALKDKNWDKNPDIKLGMISYLGFPILYPNGKVFGTLCVLDSKENKYNNNIEELMFQFKDIIEAHLNLLINNTRSTQSEKKLKESEERYKTLFNDSPLSIILIDMKGEIIDCNPTHLKTFGYCREDLIGKSFLSSKGELTGQISPDFLPLTIKTFKSLLKGAVPEPIEIQIMNKDGNLIWVKLQTNIVDLGGNKIIQVITQNIDDVRKAEQQLKESEEKYRGLYNSIKEGIILTDIEGNILEANQPYLEMLGYTIEEVKELTYQQLTPEKWHEMEADIVTNQIIARGYSNEYEKEYIKKDGTIVPINISVWTIKDEDGNPTGMWGIVRDITEHKKSEALIKESEEKYRLISENINDMIAVLDSKLVYEYINESTTRKLMGYSIEDIVGKPAMNFIHPEDLRQSIKIWSDGLKVGEGAHILRFKHKDGHWVWLEVRGKAFLDKNGERKGLTVSRDITERKKSEELKEKFTEKLEKEVEIRTKELNDALEHQKLYIDQILKMSQYKSNFLLTMSHELSTPLNAILGFTELLLEGSYGEVNKEQSGFLVDIKSSAEHLLGMLTRIFEISKIESGQFILDIKEFSLNTIIEQIKSTKYTECLKKGLMFNVNELKPNMELYADPIRLKDILSNLLDNAIKYTPKGQIDLIIQEDSDHWLFKVKDTGVGIDPKDYDSIFQDFEKSETPLISSSPGAGLGLSMAKRLVNLHGGDIWVESELGKGSTFYFTIPKKRIAANSPKLQVIINTIINYFPISELLKIDPVNLTLFNKKTIKVNPNIELKAETMIRNKLKQITQFIYGPKLFDNIEKEIK